MKSYIPFFCLLIILQLWACASQSDSVKLEKNSTKTQKDKAFTLQDSLLDEVEEDEKPSNGFGATDDIKTINTPKPIIGATKEEVISKAKKSDANSNSGGRAIEALSIISYSNIIEAKTPADMPVQGHKVKLMIKNNHQYPMWYLMPVSGEKTMPIDGQFHVNPRIPHPFLAKKYGAANNQLIELIYHGAVEQSFRAFYIKAGSSLLFRNYDLGTYQEGELVPFWAIKELEVNNKKKLEDWLPFSVASSPDVVIHNSTESGAAKWVNMAENVVFPSQKVQFVQAKGIKKHQIPVGIIR